MSCAIPDLLRRPRDRRLGPTNCRLGHPHWNTSSRGNRHGTRADLLEMQSYLQAISQKAIDATVSIRYGLAHGSGVIVSEDGMILTAAHVISPRNQRALVRLSDGRQVRAKPLGRHLALDACMMKLEGNGPWPYLPAGKSSSVKQGHWCVRHRASRGLRRRSWTGRATGARAGI